MKRVVLIHWKPEEAADSSEALSRSGWDVCVVSPQGMAEIKAIRDLEPVAILIDLSRMPSQGRDVGVLLRRHAGTRNIPLVFLDGEPIKVKRVQEVLPDAAFSLWRTLGQELDGFIESYPCNPVVPGSNFAAYSTTPLHQKLGIRSATVLGLVDAPAGFETLLRPLPDDVTMIRNIHGEVDLLIWFCRDSSILKEEFNQRSSLVRKKGAMWVAWPKKASGLETDLSQTEVRKFGLARQWVDYKICSIDRTWSGLLFTRREKV